MKKLITLLYACVLTIAASTGPVAAPDPSNNQLAAAESIVNNCFVQSVAALVNRVHILCSGQQVVAVGIGGQPVASQPGALSSGAVRYFAVENSVTANAMALTVLSVANAALERNRTLTIMYRTNPNENPAGCGPSDCRRIVGVVLNLN